jgi:DNA-3-methyladenine glycosylase II
MLTDETLSRAVRVLARRDPHLRVVVRRHGVPPLWRREPGFATIVHLILEQQVSLASAQAAFDRLAARLGAVEPAPFLTLDDGELRTIGFSRQKTRYARLLAESLLDGSLDLGEIAALDDDTARSRLTALTGIGPWTADVYLVMALRRPDAFPAGDLALQIAAQEVKRLPERPTAAALELLAEAWRPHRATAARLLWLQYLASRGLPL